ncbi:DUF4446 family protein [Candidatus Gottesmanbacteria bacterium]|nr:DUF4446 family protein [Candidatus Gottesmanbacteria bacterium]
MVLTDSLILGLLALLIIGFCTLVYIVWKLQTHYNRLTQGMSNATLTQVLNRLLGELGSLNVRTAEVEGAVRAIKAAGMEHIQRIGLVRFNPFSDTGSNQSFTMAILDGHNNGIIMTSLYTRMGNRWYVKLIRDGKGKDIELSKEELSAIGQAIGER